MPPWRDVISFVANEYQLMNTNQWSLHNTRPTGAHGYRTLKNPILFKLINKATISTLKEYGGNSFSHRV